MSTVMRTLLAAFTPTPKALQKDVFPARAREVVAAAGTTRFVPDAELSEACGEPVSTKLYFAYGSNLLSDVFCKRRGINPLQVIPCVVKGYALTFDLPAIPFLEPSMANVRRCAHADGCEHCVVHGVAYRITSEQMAHLHRTELSYDLVPHPAAPYDDRLGELTVELLVVLPSVRLLEPHEQPLAPPSLRYVDILRRGAKERGLAQHWVDRLHAQPHQPPASIATKVAFGAVLLLPGLLLLLADRVASLHMSGAERAQMRLRAIQQLQEVVWGVWRFFFVPASSRAGLVASEAEAAAAAAGSAKGAAALAYAPRAQAT